MNSKVFVLFFVVIGLSACVGWPDQGQPFVAESGDNYPTIRTTLQPSNPSVGDTITLTISAEDDLGVESLAWKSSGTLSGSLSGDFSCRLQTTCSYSWELTAENSGVYDVVATVVDSSGQTLTSPLKLDVQAFMETRSPLDDVVENTDPIVDPISLCGNGICDSGETSDNCADCTSAASEGDGSCNSNYDCGDEQICSESVCIDVDCRTDSDCSGCRRCSYNSCVKCAQGPYGCSC